MSNLTVIGAGSWGTALALQLARNGHRVHLWGHNPEKMTQMAENRCNRQYLPDIPFPEHLIPTADLKSAFLNADAIILVVPSHAFHETLNHIRPYLKGQPILWAIKGFAEGQLLSALFQQIYPHYPFAILAGPSFAKEVALGRPTAVTIASEEVLTAQYFAELFHSQGFFCYTADDIIGAQIGGAVKNVIAIATGIADGLNYGANTRSALITRGLREISRLSSALNGKSETLMGLAGLGDLVLTCTDDLSRNRRFGLALGRGKSASEAKMEIGQVVEGEGTAHETWLLAQKLGIRMPITEHLHLMLSGQLSLNETIKRLLDRSIKQEHI